MLQFSKPELATQVLLIENVTHMAKIIREMLFSIGFRHVHRVTNVVHAYQFVAESRPGLIIGEVNINPVGSARFCKALRIAADSPDRRIPVLLTLTEATERAVSQARDAGANFVMVKPLSLTGLGTKIAAALRAPGSFVNASTYTGPERRRRAGFFNGSDRRSERQRQTSYRHPAHSVLEVDAEVLAGREPAPLEMTLEDNDRVLRTDIRPKASGRTIMATQLEEGMELAQSVKGADGAILVPAGIVVRGDLIAMICRLLEQGKIPPLVRVLD